VEPTAGKTETLFYDGHCALCHGTVKFVLKYEKGGAAFRFAPLQGSTFQALVPAEKRAGLPDSIVIRTSEGSLLVRSDAALHILQRLSGGWRVLAAILATVPRVVRDAGYDFIAGVRYRVFGKREELCPIVPSELRARFDP
jgi:predicted DCC family thiol-disulfide oxidoreductase YuxK